MEKILIIDDSPTQARVLKQILEDDYKVTLAHSAEEGLAQAQSGDYSLILLDAIMPGIDGFMLLKTLQEEIVTRHIPVIMITSLSGAQHEERGLILGAVDYIVKPYYPPIVKARVNNHIKLHRYYVQIEQLAVVDQLTGVANRRRYDEVSKTKWGTATRMHLPISLCMFDIDKFKLYNDTFGHPAGDKVIASVAGEISSHLRRSTDFFARYGGEEFVGIILGDSAAATFQHLQKIRQSVENLHIPHSELVAPWVTVSIGGITVVPKAGDELDTYLKMADTMLYDAKRFGRNQVVWSNEKREQWREKPAAARETSLS